MKTKKLTIIVASYLISSLLLSGSLFFFQPLVSQGASGYDVYIVKAITDSRILPTTYPITSIGNEINITAALGEYEPASFVVRATQSITAMQASPTSLTSGSNIIPASAIDIRYVKAWYQAGEGIEENNKRILKPELLLKDPNLVKVDLTAQTNYLRNPDGTYTNISDPNVNVSNIQPQDASTLQTVDIPVNQNQQYWITVLVPAGTPAGTYQGTINLTASNVASANIPIKVTVLPFALEKPNLIYSIYYGANLIYYYWDQDKGGDMTYAWRTPERYLAEMKDLKAHGIDYPQLGERNDTVAIEELKLRQQAGLPMSGPLFTIGIELGVDPPSPEGSNAIPTTQTELDRLKTKVQARIAMAKQYGFSDTYIYGLDEAHDPELTAERPAFQAVHDVGGKTYVATCDYCALNWENPALYDTFGIIGNLLDLAVEGFVPQSSIAQKYHSIGHKVFSYGNPQCGVEQPETYRRNYGLLLWKAGYDGAMDCCYMMNYGPTMWNDFDTRLLSDENYRDHVMAYPAMHGVIDTIEWEGFREGVDDTRYLATLQKAITNSTNTPLKTEAQNWLNSLNVSNDLYTTRATMIDYTTRLTNSSPTYKAEDVNSDGQVNTQDIQAATNQILGTQSWPRADVNQDGKYDVKDLQRIANVILGV